MRSDLAVRPYHSSEVPEGGKLKERLKIVHGLFDLTYSVIQRINYLKGRHTYTVRFEKKCSPILFPVFIRRGPEAWQDLNEECCKSTKSILQMRGSSGLATRLIRLFF